MGNDAALKLLDIAGFKSKIITSKNGDTSSNNGEQVEGLQLSHSNSAILVLISQVSLIVSCFSLAIILLLLVREFVILPVIDASRIFDPWMFQYIIRSLSADLPLLRLVLVLIQHH
jgi:hypothetical protein